MNMDSIPTILVIGCLENRHAEVVFLREQILGIGGNGNFGVRVLDVSGGNGGTKGIPDEEIVGLGPDGGEMAIDGRGDSGSIQVLKQLCADGNINAIVAVAGSMNVELIVKLLGGADLMGLPTLLVATSLTNHATATIKDHGITVMYSPVEIVGHLNSVLMSVLSHAAGAAVGVVSADILRHKAENGKISTGKRIAMIMSEKTAKCADLVRTMLTATPGGVSEHEMLIFQTTQDNRQLLLAQLIEKGQVDAVIDLVAFADDDIAGSAYRAVSAAIQKRLPVAISIDIEADHSPNETAQSNILDQISDPSKVKILVPAGPTTSSYSSPQLLSLRDLLSKLSPQVKLVEVPDTTTVNSEGFAKAICENLLETIGIDPRTYRLANARRRQWSFDHGKSVNEARRASLLNIPDAD